MDSQQIQLIRTSWTQVALLGDGAAALFYERLFTINTAAAELFAHTDMPAQHAKLIQALDFAVANLDQPERLMPILEKLGKQHADYGVRDAHFDVVGQALLWTLEQGLGKQWSPKLCDAWSHAYTVIATVMRQAMAGERERQGIL